MSFCALPSSCGYRLRTVLFFRLSWHLAVVSVLTAPLVTENFPLLGPGGPFYTTLPATLSQALSLRLPRRDSGCGERSARPPPLIAGWCMAFSMGLTALMQ
jgi:hypothetical protein